LSYQFRRIQDVEADITYRFSTAGMRNRHPSDRIRALINASWQRLRAIVSLADDGTFLQATDPALLPTTAAVSGEVYAEIDWPVDAARIYGVRVQDAAGQRWRPLKKIAWAAFHDFQYDHLIEGWRRQPNVRAYATRAIPSANETTEVAGKIMLVPVPKQGSYRLWYMQAWQPQVEDSDLLPGHEDWIEFVIYDVMIKMLGPDADSRKSYTQWAAERQAARALIESTAMRLSDGMSLEPRDARGDGEDDHGWGGPL
jgi:hypothetical protein